MDLLEQIRKSAGRFGSLMIESHLTKKLAVHRKPIFKNGKVFVNYFKCEYEVFDGRRIFPDNPEIDVWIYKIRRPGWND
jgi:hypothetical protein